MVLDGPHVARRGTLESTIAFAFSSENGEDKEGLTEDNNVLENVQDVADDQSET